MKKALLALSAGVLLISGSAFADSENVSKTFNVAADTWVRENNTKWNQGGGQPKIELQRIEVKDSTDSVTGYTSFAGLVAFEFEVPSGMKVQKAEIKLVTERYKGNAVSVRGYNNDFAENTNWETEGSYIASALENEPVVIFTPAGEKGKAITDAIKDENQNLAAWTNTIDVTNFLKTLPLTAHRVNFLLTQDGDKKGDQDCFYTKENTGTDENAKTDAMKNLSAEALVPVLTVTFAEDANTTVDTLSPTADTWIRKNNDAKHGGDGNMEIKYSLNDNNARDLEFYGLMSFALPDELNSDNYNLDNVQLRLTCTFNKGSRTIELYPYPASFEENTIFADEENKVRTALDSAPICEFDAKGQGNKSMGDKGINEDYRNAEAWTSYIDLTDYVKSLSDKSKFGILLTKKNADANNSIKFATKEAEDMENTNSEDGNVPFTIAAKDLRPQLFVTYTKNDTTFVQTIELNEEAPVEYYTLQGVKVANPTKGLYIVKQGNKAKKVMLR